MVWFTHQSRHDRRAQSNLQIGSDTIEPVATVRDVRVHFNKELRRLRQACRPLGKKPLSV
jgi:hypothetical protein